MLVVKYCKLLIFLTLCFDIFTLYMSYLNLDMREFLVVLISSFSLGRFILTSSELRKIFRLKEKDRFSIVHLINPFSMFLFSFLLYSHVGNNIKWLVYLLTVLLSLELLLVTKDERTNMTKNIDDNF